MFKNEEYKIKQIRMYTQLASYILVHNIAFLDEKFNANNELEIDMVNKIATDQNMIHNAKLLLVLTKY